MHSEDFDFIESGTGRWTVYAKSSYFALGAIEWVEGKNAYEYVPNSNGKLIKVTRGEKSRGELLEFCKERTAEKLESGGNR